MTDAADEGQQTGSSDGPEQAGPAPDISKLPGISAIRSDQGAAFLAAVQAQIDASGSSQQSGDGS